MSVLWFVSAHGLAGQSGPKIRSKLAVAIAGGRLDFSVDVDAASAGAASDGPVRDMAFRRRGQACSLPPRNRLQCHHAAPGAEQGRWVDKQQRANPYSGKQHTHGRASAHVDAFVSLFAHYSATRLPAASSTPLRPAIHARFVISIVAPAMRSAFTLAAAAHPSPCIRRPLAPSHRHACCHLCGLSTACCPPTTGSRAPNPPSTHARPPGLRAQNCSSFCCPARASSFCLGRRALFARERAGASTSATTTPN